MNFPTALEQGYASRLNKRRQALSSLVSSRMGPGGAEAASAVTRTISLSRGAMAPDAASFLGTAKALEVAVTREVARLLGVAPETMAWQKAQVDALLSSWAKDNAALVAKMEAEMLQDVQQRLSAAPPEVDLQALAAERFAAYEARARLIARDQLGTLQVKLTELRSKGAGAAGYRWVTRKDARVRPEHQERHGKVFSWDSPPTDGHPGVAIACRCVAEPLREVSSVSVGVDPVQAVMGSKPTVMVTTQAAPQVAPPPEPPVVPPARAPEVPQFTPSPPPVPPPKPPEPPPAPVLTMEAPTKPPEATTFEEAPRPPPAPPPPPVDGAAALLEREYQEFLEEAPAKAYGQRLITQRKPMTDQEAAAVGSYSGGGFIEINAALRSGRTHRSVAAIDSALAKGVIDEDLVVFRGVGNNHPILSKASLLKVGAVIQEDAYTSTSLARTVAFGGGPMLRIKLPAGSKAAMISDLSDHPEEIEILLARGARLQVLGVGKLPWGRTVIDVLLLPEGS